MRHKKVSIQPIEDMQFAGLHWIEASAGTGKTYTLSSLMVRILLEKYLPGQVIATTFTRKASAELKSRIRSRLYDTLRYLEACRDLTERQLLQKAEQEPDILFAVLLRTFVTRLNYACERLKLVIDQLDELFVGTLDSFSQKLLREFAFESGRIERAALTDDAKSYTRQLIHDVLREWIQQQPQHIIDYLLLNKKLKSQDAYIAVVENSLNFASAQFKTVPQPEIDLAQFEQQMQTLQQIDTDSTAGLADYYSMEGQYHTFIAKKWRDENRMQVLLTETLPVFLSALQQQGAYALFAARHAMTLKLLADLATKKVLNKCSEAVSQGFEQHPLIQLLRNFVVALQNLSTALQQLDSYLQFHLASEVRKRLPQLLQQKGETTFSQQIRTLAEALQGEQGQRFAAFVHARYPLILVDEFQDTSQDQDNILAQIWRYPARVSNGCMIMVGDRKQAIYGFRGGDMLTFLKAHQDVFGKDGHAYNLIENHRSVRPLVEVVDALFQRQPDFGEQVFYSPVRPGRRAHPELVDDGLSNPAPLRWIQLQDKNTEAEQVAWKIQDLLNRGIQGSLYFAEPTVQRGLDANDIAVLSKSHNGLDQVQSALQYLGIQVNRPSKKSVFAGQVARDAGAMLTAIMFPYDETKIRRVLLSRMMGFNLQQLIQLEQHADGLNHYIQQFSQLRDMWLNQGFLPAWQYCLSQFAVWEKLVAIPRRDNERAVVNLRHITELLSQHSEHYPRAQHLYHWYLRQLSSPAEREWEMERQLSSQAGVQLMTIHQSKGLEFKVVFLLGADRDFREMNKTLNFSVIETANPQTGQVEVQRVVAVNDKTTLNPAEIEQHDQRALAEHHRLWYVALTRASYRVYAMLSDQKQSSTTGLAFWRGQGVHVFQHVYSVQEPLLTEQPRRLKRPLQQPCTALTAQALPQQRFYPRGKTSFSYLARHLSRQQIQDALAVAEPLPESAEDDVYPSELETVMVQQTDTGQPIAWIKANFPMGTVAGNFLHEIFEHIDFKDQASWPLEIHRRFKNTYAVLWSELTEKFQKAFPQRDQVEATLIQWMTDWLQDVLNTPILSDFQLSQLQTGEYLAEFPFYLALSDRVLAIQRIHQLFAEHGISMPEFREANSARYLNGSIDLVLFDGRQYHIADYKSNFLGQDQQDYRPEAVQASMSQASYWLQAALYLVALHRYLSVQLAGYQIERDLGGATYLYLRGMNAQPQQGCYSWNPGAEFILRLDAILGYYYTQTQPA
ncbi:UvrD-helicase domain-containing protein [Acinetobacter sp. WZC-1]|uniref:UvrD-helicase domain-containing protein n=1 Tax=Acinetobacter sp. WZC-1 TaxID=3459034 RepID=UPI00403D5E41